MVDLERLQSLATRAETVMSARRTARGQRPKTERRSVRNNAQGTGSILRERLKTWGIAGCAGCDRTAQKMDAHGPEWCHEHRRELAREILPRARDWSTDVPGFRQALGLADRVGAGDAVLLAAIERILLAPAIQEARRFHRQTADVLLIVSTTGNQWKEEQTGFLDLLRESGISCVAASVHEVPDLLQLIAETRPKLCLIRAMPFTADQLRPVVAAWPEIRFYVCCHSLPSHLAVFRHGVEKFVGFVRLANEADNLWLATPDERQPWGAVAPSVWLPNTVSEITPGQPGIVGPLDLSLVGRRDAVKSFPNQIIAAAIANRTRPVRLHLIVNGPHEDFRDLAEACGLRVYTHGWLPHDQHRRRVAKLIDIGLQCGFCESFNYVALEHLLAGKPVVGSRTVRFLPDRFQADPNDVDEIAALILALAADIERDPRGSFGTCRAIGEQVASHLNGALVETLKRLL